MCSWAISLQIFWPIPPTIPLHFFQKLHGLGFHLSVWSTTPSSARSSRVSSCSWRHYSKVSDLSSIPFSWGQPGQVTDGQLDILDRQTDSEQQSETQTARDVILGAWFTSIGRPIGWWKLPGQWILTQLLAYYWPDNMGKCTDAHTCKHTRIYYITNIMILELQKRTNWN